MAFTLVERPSSPVGGTSIIGPPFDASAEREFVADGIDDAEVVRQLAFQMTPGAIPTMHGILYRKELRLSRQGHMLYYVSVTYGPRDRGKWTWDIDTTGGTFNIKASRQHIASYVAAGEVVKDHKGAIGRQLDGSVDGVDIVIPSMKINVSFTHPLGVVTPAYARFLRGLTGKVNSKPIFGFAAGEVLMLGARGSDGTDTEATVNYSFAVEENLQNKLIGGITVATKDGHDYAWVEFKNADNAGQPVTIPRQIDVCRVYERIDLAGALGFGA